MRAEDDPPPAFSRHEGQWAFDGIAASYGDSRPPYPERVYEILQARCHLGPGQRVLDIGAGSGQATRWLVDAGAHVVAVEPSQAFADELSARLAPAELDIVLSPFEDVDLPTGAFDLVTAATSFHWLDTDPALVTIRRILRTGGWLALWWNVFGDPSRPDPFHDATLHVLGGLAPSPSAGVGGIPYALDVDARTSDLTKGGFEDVEHEAMRYEIERIAEVQFGGRVDREMVTPIYTAHT